MMGCEEQGTREKGLKGARRRIRIKEARQREGRGNDGKGEGVKRGGDKKKTEGNRRRRKGHFQQRLYCACAETVIYELPV